MKKRILILTILLCVVGFTVACNDNVSPQPQPKSLADSLIGEWKWVLKQDKYIVNNELVTGELIEADEKVILKILEEYKGSKKFDDSTFGLYYKVYVADTLFARDNDSNKIFILNQNLLSGMTYQCWIYDLPHIQMRSWDVSLVASKITGVSDTLIFYGSIGNYYYVKMKNEGVK